MIKITSIDLKNLEHVGHSGMYGTVYKKDDTTAYKIYHEKCKFGGRLWENPVHSLPKYHYKLLLKRSKKMTYSGGITDLIKVDGRFNGVATPFFDGPNLAFEIEQPADKKITMAREFVCGAKELDNLRIYKSDYKPNNAILTENGVKLIDLDDCLNHVCLLPNPLYRAYSRNKVASAIQLIFREDYRYHVSWLVERHIKRNKWLSTASFDKIDDYINNKESKKDILYVDEDTNPEFIRRMCDEHKYAVVIVLDYKHATKFSLLRIIKKFQEKGVDIYDFIFRDYIDEYRSIENINEEMIHSKGETKRLIKERPIIKSEKK